MNLMKKITITAATALIIASTTGFAMPEQTSINTADQKKSQLEDQQVGFCWVYVNGQWIWDC